MEQALFYTDMGDPRRLQNFLNVQCIYEIYGEKVVSSVAGKCTLLWLVLTPYVDTPLLVFDTFIIASSLPYSRGFIPYPLLWIDFDVSPQLLEKYKIVYEPVEESFFFMVIGPQNKWLIKHPRDQFIAFAKKLMALMIKTEDETEICKGTLCRLSDKLSLLGRRNGSFEFHGIGRYKGGWKSGYPHGDGVFHRTDGVYFKGLWDSKPPIRVGCVLTIESPPNEARYGTMTEGSGNDITTAWFNEINLKKGK